MTNTLTNTQFNILTNETQSSLPAASPLGGHRTNKIFKVVPDTHNLLVPDTQITHWRGTEALTRPANIT